MHAGQINLLIVEPDPDEVNRIKGKLLKVKDVACNVICVGRVEDALSRLAQGHIDLVILDVNLPASRGINTFNIVFKRFAEVPILALTDGKDAALADCLQQEGAQACLVKGQGNIGALMPSIRYALERKLTGQQTLKHLRELNEAKSRFVAEVSHEIRTPLAVIREFVALVRDEICGALNTKQKQCLDAVLRNSDRLTDLIEHILDLARIEAGKAELNRTKVDLAALIAQFHDDFDSLCRSKKQKLILDIPDNLPTAHCDAASIHQILANLLGNAHKFTAEGGIIHLRVGEAGRFLRVGIEDNGPGICTEDQAMIFEAFTRVGRKSGPRPKGTGLGLTIAKGLVELNGGYILVDSAPGKGSCFSFTVPIYEKELPLRILIVDDNENIVHMIEDVLKHSGIKLEVKSSLSGYEALVIVGEFKPNLVILDIHLAEVEGRAILLSLRQRASRILAISGDVQALSKISDQGADDYLVKPFTAAELLDKIRAMLNVESKHPEPDKIKGV